MEFRTGSVIGIKHFSADVFKRVTILEAQKKKLNISYEKVDGILELFEDDPLVVVMEEDENLYVGQAVVEIIDYKMGVVTIRIVKMNLANNKREFKRYYTSMFAKIIKASGEYFPAYISNVSKEGLSLMTYSHLQKFDEVTIEVQVNNEILQIDLSVVWRKENVRIYEYGILANDQEREKMKKIFDKVMKDQNNELKNGVFSGFKLPLMTGG